MIPFAKRLSMCIALGLGLTLAAAASAQNIVLRVAHTNAPGEVQDEGLKYLKKKLEEKTGGKASIEIFPHGQLGNETQAIESVLLGTLDMTVPSNGTFSNFVKEFRVFDMPFLFRDVDHLNKVASGPAVAPLREAARKRGFHLLGIYSSGFRHILTKTPVRSMADLKNRKIRTIQNPIYLETFKAFGANAVPLAYNELYGALQTGVVDGAEAANTNYLGAKLYEVANNWALVGWLHLTAPLVISEKKYASLPPDVQKALDEAGAESAAWERNYVDQSDAPLLEKIKALGVNITRPDSAPFREASRQVYNKMITDPGEKKLLETVLSIK